MISFVALEIERLRGLTTYKTEHRSARTQNEELGIGSAFDLDSVQM